MRFDTKQDFIMSECRVDTGGVKIYIRLSNADLTSLFDDAQTCEDFAEFGEVVQLEDIYD